MPESVVVEPGETTNAVLQSDSFSSALQAQVDVSLRLQVPCAILVLKLEYDELYEDLYGAEASAELARYFSQLVVYNVRDTDTVGWMEDGCVGVVIRCVTPHETSAIATRIQHDIAAQPLLVGAHNIHLAAQVGGVWYSGQRPMTLTDLKQQAYDALPS